MRRQILMLVAALHCVAPAVAQVHPMPRFPDGATAKLVVPLGDTLNVDRLDVTIFDSTPPSAMRCSPSCSSTGKQLAYSYHEAQSRHAQLPGDLAQSPSDLEAARHDITNLIEIAVAKTVKEMIELRAERE
jgi:hypothetical protein